MVLALQPCWAQDFSDTYQSLKRQYPEEQAVYNNYFEDIDISSVGDSLVAISKHHRELVHLGDQSSAFAKDKIYASLFYKINNIEASTLIPHKKRYKTLKVTDFKETFDKTSQVFYDDTKVINFIYPAIAPGVHTVLKYEEHITDPRFIGSLFFRTFFPIVYGRYSITVDEGVELDLQILHDPEKEVKVSKEHIKSRVKYTYEVFDTEKIKTESRAPSVKYYTPHLNVVVQSYTNQDGKRVKVLSSPEDLYGWYKTFIKDLKYQESEEIQAIVTELVAGAESEEEKVKRIFYWVQENIKYIAFEDGMRGLIPHNGAYVFEKRFGDCKDMTSILVNMMHHAGIESHFTWIGTRDIPYAYSQLPSPLVDNHMIATYISKGNYYFLDATSQYSPFDMPSSMIQNKEALIAINDSIHQIVSVPEVAKTGNVISDTSHFWLEKNSIKGKGNISLSGYPKVFSTYRLIKTNEKKVKDYLTTLLGRGSNKFFLDHFEISHLQNLDEPISIEYAFSVDDYYKEIGDEIYLNMNMDKSFNGDIIDKDRELPIENEFKYTNRMVSVLEIPENYQIAHLPKNDSFSNEIFGFSIKYIRENGKVIMEKTLYVDYLLLKKEDFPKWNEGIKKLSDAYNETIVLTKTDV